MTATLTLDSTNETPSARIFLGKSTRPMITNGVPTNCPRRLCKSECCYESNCDVKKSMKKEAKHRAIANYLNGVYGYTDTSDITVDELYRPVT